MEIVMMIRFLKLIAILSIIVCVQHISAHIFSYSNHTNDPLKLRIQLHGVLEPWYEKIIPPKTEGERATVEFRFVAGEGPLDISRKFGFCLQEIHFAMPLKKKIKMIAPDGEDLGLVEQLVKDAKGNIQFGPWTNVVTEYVQNEGANAMLRASESFVDGLQNLATDIAKTAIGAE
jgi:hypothetical protein